MLRIVLALFLLSFFTGTGLAQEKVLDNISVDLGIMSWEEIQKSLKEKPAIHTGEYHHWVAQETAKMHGGGGKGRYHLLVVLKNAKTGERVTGEVKVEAFAKLGPYKKTITLKPMLIDGFFSFGGFMKLPFKVAHTFTVSFRLNKDEPYKKVEFERDIQ